MITELGGLLARRTLITEGGLATDLDAHGHDLSDDLWSARLLRDDPDAIRAVHRRFFAAGADFATIASYQASYDGFARRGIERTTAANPHETHRHPRPRGRTGNRQNHLCRRFRRPLRRLPRRRLRVPRPLRTDKRQLSEWHQPRLDTLLEAEPDLLAIETIST